MDRLKTIIALDWRKRAAGRARVPETINEVLDQGLPPAYTRQVFQAKCAALFEHVYETYPDSGQSSPPRSGTD